VALAEGTMVAAAGTALMFCHLVMTAAPTGAHTGHRFGETRQGHPHGFVNLIWDLAPIS